MEQISAFILALRDEYVPRYAANYRQINNGWCVAFAEEVESSFPDSISLSNDFFMEDVDVGWNGYGNDRWDEEELVLYHSPSPIPVNELTKEVGGYHRWLYYEGKHYDAECPNGVTNFFDLPFFKRQLADYV